jgi:hypothetical protein
MSNNITLNPGIGGQNVATEEISGAHIQRSKLVLGNYGVDKGDISESNPIPVLVGDGPNRDAFARLRTSSPFTIFDSNLVETDGSLFWDTSTSGGGTLSWLSAEAAYQLGCGTASGDVAIRQTKEYFRYQPGKSQLVFLTGVMGALKANVTQRLGYFDADNGLFFEQNGTDLRVVQRSKASGSVVDTAVNQSAWNTDKLDGTGASGLTIDMSKSQIFVIDFEWLGVGRVRFGFIIDGKIYYCHQFLNANSLSIVYMARPHLPCRYEIRNTGVAASPTTMKQICCTVISEGGFNLPGVMRTIDTGSSAISVGTTLIPLLSLRLKSANIRAKLRILRTHIEVVNTQTLLWKMLWNPSLTGPTWTSVGSTAISEYDVAASAVTGGETLLSGYVTGNDSQDVNDILNRLHINSTIAGVSDIVTIAAIRVGASNANACASLSYEEIY